MLNSTPLIYLAKIGLIDVISKLRIESITSPSVKQEVIDRGLAMGAPEAEALSKLLDEKVVKVVAPRNTSLFKSLLSIKGLSTADAEILALAKEHKGTAIIDDKLARSVAKVYSISLGGTAHLLKLAIEENIITKDRAKRSLDEMIAQGWRCGPEDYAKILKQFDNVESPRSMFGSDKRLKRITKNEHQEFQRSHNI